MAKKECSKCKEFKGLDCFGKDKSRKDKKQGVCKECRRKYHQEHKEEAKKYRQEHKEEAKEYMKQYYQEHSKKLDQQKREYYQGHKEEAKQYNKVYHEEHKEEIGERVKKYNQEHKEEIAEKTKKYHQEHKEETNQRQRNRLITDPIYRLNCIMSKVIGKVKKPSIKNGRPWKDLVPYTLIELKKHLIRTLPEGYTWKDFQEGKLHIDHILPKVSFKYEKPEDLSFQICWNLDNLRLLPAKENLRKHTKLIKPFQKHFDIEVKVEKRKEKVCRI